MTPSEKRAKTIYLRTLDNLLKKIVIDNLNEDVIFLPRIMAEEVFGKTTEKNSEVYIYGKKIKAI